MKSGVALALVGGGTALLTLESPLYSLPPCIKSNTLITQSSIPSIFPKSHRLRLILVARAHDSTQPTTTTTATTTTPTNKDVVPDNEFSLAKVSFGVIGLGLGISLLSYGFGAYFNILPGSEWSAIMLTYGFPLAIIGMALKYAELKPAPCITYSDAEKLREKCATPILKQVRNDVTRYRYGDEQHLDEALKRIFQYGLGGGIPRRNAPILQMIREEVTEDGRYSLVLAFEAKALELSEFEKRQFILQLSHHHPRVVFQTKRRERLSLSLVHLRYLETCFEECPMLL